MRKRASIHRGATGGKPPRKPGYGEHQLPVTNRNNLLERSRQRGKIFKQKVALARKNITGEWKKIT